jgi:hypothetical protein
MKQTSKTDKNDQALGTIYRCLNTVTNRSYIGQTRGDIEKRKSGHVNTTAKTRTKFGNALRKYGQDNWVWSILEQAPYEDLDILERKYIAEFNSYADGYNSNTGQTRCIPPSKRFLNTVGTVYDFYSAEHGVVSHTMTEMVNRFDLVICGVSQIVKKDRPRYKEWVLAEFKDDYDKILGLYEFWHPIHGYIKCNQADLVRKYNIQRSQMSALVLGKAKRVRNWYLFENKHLFKKIYKE